MTRKRTLALIVALTCLSAQFAVAADSGALRVGAAKVDITPKDLTKLEPITLGGGDFDGVHDPIFARALVLDSGSGPVAIVAIDAVHLMDMMPLRQRIQSELGIAADHIVITASHDHSAPRLGGGGPFFKAVSPEQDAYMAATNDKIVDALKRAKSSMQPARMGLGTGSADVNVNRDMYQPPRGWGAGYNPAGKSDKTISVVKFETLTGEPIAILFNYAVHSIVTLNTIAVSSDLAGTAAHLIEQRYNDKVVALFTIGAAGDQNPKFSGTIPGPAGGTPAPVRPPAVASAPGATPPASKPPAAPDRTQIRQLAYQAMDAEGFILGSEVLRVTNQIQARTTAPRIAAAESQFLCPAKPEKMSDVYTYQDFKDGVPIRVGVILVDQIAFTWVSGEVVTNIYWHLKSVSPLANTIMITLANGRAGYLVDDATYDTPNFEVNTTPVLRGCAENGIVNGLVDLIKKGL